MSTTSFLIILLVSIYLTSASELSKVLNKASESYLFDSTGKLRQVSFKLDANTKKLLAQMFKREAEIQIANPINFVNKVPKFKFSNKQINFTLYTRKYTKGINLKSFNFSNYNIELPTKIVTHGFLSSGTADVCIDIKNNYLKVKDINVIVMDWSPIAGNIIYPIPALATGKVADYCGEFLVYLVKAVGVKLSKLHFIGHSLGAQIAGFTGNRVKRDIGKSLERCTGLDPAGPLFDLIHLTKNNCKFVDIIHTDKGFFGLDKVVGDVDFYPNGGDNPQPGCEKKLLVQQNACSHVKSWQLYAESILDITLYKANCSNTENVMGAGTSKKAQGKCSLTTK